MLEIQEKDISYYINRLQRGEYFATVGYSDAEWFCILGHSIGGRSGLGQIFDRDTGIELLNVLKTRQSDPNFMFAIPKVLWTIEGLVNAGIPERIEKVLIKNDIQTAFYERDMVTDSMASRNDLYPFIKQLQQMRTVVIGPKELEGLGFLGYDHLVKISSPNLHMESDGIAKAVENALQYRKPAVYLVSAGLSAALIIDQLYDRVKDSFFMDCGSIWDAFVGLGGQRAWRGRLFKDPEKLEQWKHDNLFGKHE